MPATLARPDTARKAKVLRALLDPASWGGNTADAADLHPQSGPWDAGTPTAPAARLSIGEAVSRVFRATNGGVHPGDFALVVGPGLAIRAGHSPEIEAYLADSPWLLHPSVRNRRWGLPDTLFSVPVVVELGVRLDASGGGTVPEMPDGCALLLCREGVTDDELRTDEGMSRVYEPAALRRAAGFLITKCLG